MKMQPVQAVNKSLTPFIFDVFKCPLECKNPERRYCSTAVSSKYLLHYRALKDYIEADTLGDLYHILRQVKVGVESCTFAVLKAVKRATALPAP
jgi:hypothetical protein